VNFIAPWQRRKHQHRRCDAAKRAPMSLFVTECFKEIRIECRANRQAKRTGADEHRHGELPLVFQTLRRTRAASRVE